MLKKYIKRGFLFQLENTCFMWKKIIAEKDLNPTEKLILLYLYSIAKQDEAFTEISELTKTLSISRQAYFNNIGKLKERAYVTYSAPRGRPREDKQDKATKFKLLFLRDEKDSFVVKERIKKEQERILKESNIPIKTMIELLSTIYPDTHESFPLFLARIISIKEDKDSFVVMCKGKMTGKTNFLIKKFSFRGKKIELKP